MPRPRLSLVVTFALILLALAVITGLAYELTRALELPLAFAAPAWLRALGVTIGLVALAGFAWVLRHRSVAKLATSTAHTLRWTTGRADAESAPTEALVVDGPHKLVRHPWYASILLLVLGLALALGSTVAIVALLLLFAWYRAIVIPAEERELVARYGKRYQDYQARTPPLVPRLVLVGEEKKAGRNGRAAR